MARRNAANVIFYAGILLQLCMSLTDAQQQDDQGHCIWYDGESGWDSTLKNYPYNGPAKPLNDSDAVEILRNLCPQYAVGNNPLTCCSSRQLRSLNTNLAASFQIFGRCPACLRNFVNIYCALTCAPHQSEFLLGHVKHVEGKPDYVEAVDYAMTWDFALGFFDSCKDVRLPSTGSKAIEVICGNVDVNKCNVTDVFKFIGSVGNPGVPFQINFNLTNSPILVENSTALIPMNVSVSPCNELVMGKTYPQCSCQDCNASCDMPRPPPPPWTLGDVNANWPYFRTEQLIIRVNTMNHQIMWERKNSNSSSETGAFYSAVLSLDILKEVLALQSQISKITASFPERNATISLNDICFASQIPGNRNCTIMSLLGYFQNDKQILERVVGDANYINHLLYCISRPESDEDPGPFGRSCLAPYGGVVYPSVALRGYPGLNYQYATSIVITFWVTNGEPGSLQYRIARAWEAAFVEYMKKFSSPNILVTSASELSRPTFRREQLVIRVNTTKYGKYWKRYDSAPSTEIRTFSTALKLDILKEILALQLHIEKMIVPFPEQNSTGVMSLKDICFTSLQPENGNCTIMSPLNYFQNDEQILERRVMDEYGFLSFADYMDHFMFCARVPNSANDGGPFNRSCLGTFGGPIYPSNALRGYPGDNYVNATSIVITFWVTNDEPGSLQYRKAIAWEGAFVEYMKKFSSQHISVTFSSALKPIPSTTELTPSTHSFVTPTESTPSIHSSATPAESTQSTRSSATSTKSTPSTHSSATPAESTQSTRSSATSTKSTPTTTQAGSAYDELNNKMNILTGFTAVLWLIILASIITVAAVFIRRRRAMGQTMIGDDRPIPMEDGNRTAIDPVQIQTDGGFVNPNY